MPIFSFNSVGLDDGVRFPGGARVSSLRHLFQTGSVYHPVSYVRGNGDSSSGCKRPVGEADRLQLERRLWIRGTILPFPHMHSCCGT